ncbi:SRPBCC family protein [Kovacikia minuta CCNUW1]|uniref:SRPBCC family protein n=1 Tax=Kovacikia minuta TaxID=2931930 RepID=UPI001CCB8E71|nr:SRPBCC family protein [Kovacikia minuta]UBF28829.1 SRPBCC family protein [Kovacikia minuta CCNUW1]
MEINLQAPVIAQHQIVVNASSEAIWQVLSDINRWTDWNPNISEATLEGALKPGSIFRWKAGGTAILSTLQEIEPQRRLSWTGQVIGTRAIHTWMLEPQVDSVLVRTEESFEGWLVRLSKRMMQRMLDQSLQEWLECLKQKAEAAT